MTMLTKIGNSQGVRIPKAIVKQAHLENADIEFEVTKDGLLLKPTNKTPRSGWEEAIRNSLHVEDLDEFVEIDLDLKDWEW